jgi:hypothetical protein
MLRTRVVNGEATQNYWRPAPGVLSVTGADRTVLLALGTGRYHRLDGVGAYVWSHIEARQSAEAILVATRARYSASGVAADRIAADVSRLLDEFKQARLIAGTPRPDQATDPPVVAGVGGAEAAAVSRADTPPLPAVWRLVLALAMVQAGLALFRPRRVLRAIYAQRGATLATPPTGDWWRLVGERLERAIALYPFKTRCLVQSASTALALRRLGFDAQVCFGVRLFPFQAHAWAELGGRSVNEDPDRHQPFWRFPLIALTDL